MSTQRVYLRDFLARFIDHGGDISRIHFKSRRLLNTYKMVSLRDNVLRCMKFKPYEESYGTAMAFAWESGKSTSGIHDKFYVLDISPTHIGEGLCKKIEIMLNLAERTSH